MLQYPPELFYQKLFQGESMEENEYEILHLAQEGDEIALDCLYQKYKPIIIKKSKNAILKVSHHGLEINDIMQEGYLGLKEAIDNYKDIDNTSFYTFANLCIERKIINLIRKNISGKDKILNEAIAIDDHLENYLTDDNNTEDIYLYKDYTVELSEKLKMDLTSFESQVFSLRTKGYTTKEISKKLKKDLKSIYNAYQRIKQKIKDISLEK